MNGKHNLVTHYPRNAMKLLNKLLAITTIFFIQMNVVFAEETKQSYFFSSPKTMENWTGFYLVGNIGFINGQYANDGYNINPDLFSFTKLSSEKHFSDNQSVTGGVALGFQKQFNKFIIGFESDWMYSGLDFSMKNPNLVLTGNGNEPFNIDSSTLNTSNSKFKTDANLDWIGTVRPRIGYLITPRLAIYGTGGFAYGEINTSLRETKVFTLSSKGKANDIAVGWSIGAGAEYKLTTSFLVRGEYLFVNFNSDNMSLPFAGVTSSLSPEFNVHMAKLGIIYKF